MPAIAGIAPSGWTLPLLASGANIAAVEHVTISLSAAQRAFLDEQVANGAAGSIDDYLSALIDADAHVQASAHLETELLDGLAGPATAWTEADAAALRQRALAGR